MTQAKMSEHDHLITIEPNPNLVRVLLNGQIVADTRRALTLRETGYDLVHYIPRDDVNMDMLEHSSRATFCPYKGDAAYFSIRAGNRLAENAVWTYEDPHSALAEIKDRLAFYPRMVDAIQEVPQ